MSGRPESIAGRGDLARAWADAAWHPESLQLEPWLQPGSETVRPFVEQADAAIGTPWPQPLLTDYARYPRDGDRASYEGQVFARMDRVATAAVAAVVTGSPRHLDDVADGLQLLCEQSTWCWPAHDDVFARTGAVAPDPAHPYLDLGAGEVASLLAWCRFALGAALDARYPGLGDRMRAEVDRRILRPFTERRDWHWLGLDGHLHNWSPWIHGNVVVAAAAFADPQRARAIVDLAVDGIDRYLAAMPADGAVDEGFAYWWNGAARVLDTLEVLDRASAGTFDPSRLPGLAELVRFPLRMQLGRDWVLSFSDAEPRHSPAHPWRIAHHWGGRLGLPDVVAHASGFDRGAPAASAPNNGLGRMLAALGDEGWASAPVEPAPLPASVVLGSLSLALAREHEASAGLAIALKGGHNDENHNHNDLGSVTVALDGLPAVIDVGRPSYDARAFGPERYSLWMMRSDWHSVPEPRGALQSEGAEWRTGPLRGGDRRSLAEWSLDLGGAWPLGAGDAWTRTISLDRTASTAEVHDAWTIAPHPETRTTWLLWGELTHEGGGDGDGDGRRLRLRRPAPGSRDVFIEHDAESAELEVREVVDPVIAHSWGDRITRLRLRPSPHANSMSVRFRAAELKEIP